LQRVFFHEKAPLFTPFYTSPFFGIENGHFFVQDIQCRDRIRAVFLEGYCTYFEHGIKYNGVVDE